MAWLWVGYQVFRLVDSWGICIATLPNFTELFEFGIHILKMLWNRGGTFFSWSPAANFHCGLDGPLFTCESLQSFSVKWSDQFLRQGTGPFTVLKGKTLYVFNKSPTDRNKRKPWNAFAKDATIEGRNGLQELRASTAEAAEQKKLQYLARDYGWRVRFLTQEREEMDAVTEIQAAAFHTPSPIWDDFFFMIFKAEVLSALQYKIRHSPPNRYACLVAEADHNNMECIRPELSRDRIVGVVDATAFADSNVLCHLEGAEEYLYISGIAVRANHRRRKIATLLLKACDSIAFLWGFDYLALRAYEDDAAAMSLYDRAGYKVVSQDPPWISTWIGKKRRVLMVKRAPFEKS